jgi:hypothetical protein
LIFQGLAILALAAAGLWSLWRATQAVVGPVFLLYLLPSLLALALVPVLAYRAYAMWRAYYVLERDGLRLYWGLRAEDIPMDAVRWVRPAGEALSSLPLPLLRWPGSVLGVRRLPDGGQMEFMAVQTSSLILVATPGRIFAISPDHPEDFLHKFQRFTELGSLTPLPARSVYPTFLLARVWASPLARYLLLGGLALSLLLLGWVSLSIPGHQTISLGFTPEGLTGDPVPAVQLLLLPVLNSFFFLADVLAGLFFFRYEEGPDVNLHRPLAFVLWGSGALTALLFLCAVFFILSSG